MAPEQVARVRTGRDVCRVLRDFEARWEAGHRRGSLHSWERARILGGDLHVIKRDLEPAFYEGQKLVLAWTRPRGALVRDPVTGREIHYPKPPREETFWIEVERIVRHRSGSWRVSFRAWDRREINHNHLVRRTPPAFVPSGEADGPAVDEEQVVLESGYTTNPDQAVDNLQAVSPDFQKAITVTSRERWAEHESGERRRDVARRQGKQLTRKLRQIQSEAEGLGVDLTPRLAAMVREAEDELAAARREAA